MRLKQSRLPFDVRDLAPLGLFVAVWILFGLLTENFLSLGNLTQILVQSAPTVVVATGMTLVLPASLPTEAFLR